MNSTDYADDLALLTNISVQTESLLYRLLQISESIFIHMNSDKTEFICFKPDGVISSLNDTLLKLLNHFIYLGSNITSSESHFSRNIGKALDCS